ncbi:hypothetical protein V6N12_009000 [Hibiscus sabdariffa]|uniref:RNase H type-1 domain-containing protein n=1 Tax=Hibiscus sabdariffa TaxID=183260 RepID=A0ABR2C4K9_9ROSI
MYVGDELGQFNCSLRVETMVLSDNATTTKFREMFSRNWEVCFSHILREGNAVADKLVKLAREHGRGNLFFDRPPSAVLDLVLKDQDGT